MKYVVWGCKESEHLSYPVRECKTELEAIAVTYDLNKFSRGDEEFWWEKTE